MPKRLAFGTNLGLFARRVSRHAGRMRSHKTQQVIRRACIDTLEDRTLFSNTYLVAPWGSDWGNGSAGAPFRTIQEGANAAYWGDTVAIMGGTYRETVTPPHAGVTFTNYGGQNVTIVGTNQVSGFNWVAGSTFVSNNSPNLGEGNNQVFVDGQPLNDARFPNSSLDPSHPTKLTMQGYAGGTIYDSNLNQPYNYWAGARISVTPGDQWVSYTGVVNSSGPGWINVSLPGLSGVEQPKAGSAYYIYGTGNALDTAGEYYVTGNQLYLADQYWDNPNNHDVEVQARQFGFNLQYASNTTISGINFWACSIYAGWNSPNSLITGVTANFLGNFDNIWGSGWSAPASGIQLWGSGDVLKNSNIGYSAGDGVYVGNSNIQVLNNTIHDVDTSGTDAAGVRTYNNYILISGNTIYNAGRDGVNVQGNGDVVTWNTIHDFMLQTYDGGGIYTINIGGGGEIGFNTIYNAHKSYIADGLTANGIMLDSNSAYWKIHDNNVFNVDAALEINNNAYGDQIYNNKFSGSLWSIETNGWPGFQFNWSGTSLYNNYFGGNVEYGNGVSQWSNGWGGAVNTSPTSPQPPAPPPPAPASPPPPPPPTVTTTQTGPGYPANAVWGATAFWQYSNLVNIGGGAVGYTYNGSWLEYGGINFGSGGLSRFNANLAVDPAYAGQKIEVFLDSYYTNPIATLTVGNTGSWYNYAWESAGLTTGVSGLHNVFIVFAGKAGIANLKNWSFS